MGNEGENGLPETKSEAERESLKIAEQKLKQFLSKETGQYAVRFVSQEEYENILQEGFTAGNEVNLSDVNADRFLKFGRHQAWSTISNNYTDWWSFVKGIREEEALLGARRIISRDGGDKTQKIKILTWRDDILAKGISHEPLGFLWRILEKVKMNETDGIDPEVVRVLKLFIENEEWITQNGNFRLFIKTVRNIVKRQYAVVLFIDLDAIDPHEYSYPSWRQLKPAEEISDPASQLLGALIITKDKDVVQDIARQAANARKWSHPVFNDQGALKWPKK